jgi:hypothetical protein
LNTPFNSNFTYNVYVDLDVANIELNAPKCNHSPINRLALKPITMDIAQSTQFELPMRDIREDVQYRDICIYKAGMEKREETYERLLSG